MARRPVVNREELFSVANELAAQGRQVTALAILARLGGGSLTTIYKYLEEWESLHRSATPTSSGELPDVVQKSFLNVWKLASAEASREVVALKLEVEQLRKQLQATQAELAKALAQLESKRAPSDRELVKLIETLTKQNSELLAALASRKKR